MNQLLLFDLSSDDRLSDDCLSIEQAAEALGVSTASVRNWVKAGYLEASQNRKILHASFEKFRDNVAGVEKLTKRANKSLVDNHDHCALQARFARDLENRNDVTGAQLAVEYESALSNSFRNKEGIYYTPSNLIGDFFETLPEKRSGLTFCDPCCGTGNFLIAALEKGFSVENIYGFDTDGTAVEIAKRRVYEKTGVVSKNVKTQDFLQMVVNDSNDSTTYDVVLTNPPWGKKLLKRDKDLFASQLGVKTSTDTSALFFLASSRVVNNGGYVGMLLPDAFFNVTAFKEVREKVLSYRLMSVTDFGKPFQTLLTKAKGLVVQINNRTEDNMVTCRTPAGDHQRSQQSFIAHPKSILNFTVSAKGADVISLLLSLPHRTLVGNARWGLGIVTGNNKKFVRKTMQPGYMPVYKGRDISKDSLTTPTSFIPEDLNLYQQVASHNLYTASEKLLYRFISSKLTFFHDTEQRFMLNSANMLVLDQKFPIASQVLARYLNSDLMNWLFQAMFETHKVLRSDLECLPIFTEFLAANNEFEEQDLLDYLRIEEDGHGSYRVKE